VVRVFLGSPAATRCLARTLVHILSAPALVTLEGELGTGKTTLVRHMMRAYGVRGPVVSPSFTIAQSYQGSGDLRLHHLDLYRLSPGADVELFAWDDYLTSDAITFVEWPEAGHEELPQPDVRLTLFHDTLTSRWAEIEADAAFELRLSQALHSAGLLATDAPASPVSSRRAT
jgi:tRNA threonylcarbamoyladenosine biosynthesis protein TsaE